MKCPKCGALLKPVGYIKGEYICDNPLCPENQIVAQSKAYAEFYGETQKEIDKQK
jgi:hypothetical protein